MRYTNQKESFVDVFVIQNTMDKTITAPKPSAQKSKSNTINKDKTPQKEQVKTTNKQTNTQEKVKLVQSREVSLSEIFKNIKTNSKERAVQSNKKSAKNVSSNSASDIAKSLNQDLIKRAPKSGAKGIYNKFLGDVTQIIEERWSIYKADTNNDAKIQIFIDKFGKLSYNIISLSPNTEFNDKVRDFLGRLKDEQFPTPPDGQALPITLNLVDKLEME